MITLKEDVKKPRLYCLRCKKAGNIARKPVIEKSNTNESYYYKGTHKECGGNMSVRISKDKLDGIKDESKKKEADKKKAKTDKVSEKSTDKKNAKKKVSKSKTDNGKSTKKNSTSEAKKSSKSDMKKKKKNRNE